MDDTVSKSGQVVRLSCMVIVGVILAFALGVIDITSKVFRLFKLDGKK